MTMPLHVSCWAVHQVLQLNAALCISRFRSCYGFLLHLKCRCGQGNIPISLGKDTPAGYVGANFSTAW